MARQVHLVGSVGLRDAETVFTTVSVMLGSCCPRIPDGETGERGYWIRWQRNTFARNLGFEEVMTTRSLPGFNDNVARTFFTLRKDTDPEKIELGELGYARAATDSYRIFTRLIGLGDPRDLCIRPLAVARGLCAEQARALSDRQTEPRIVSCGRGYVYGEV